jgi:hypothetical protein
MRSMGGMPGIIAGSSVPSKSPPLPRRIATSLRLARSSDT